MRWNRRFQALRVDFPASRVPHRGVRGLYASGPPAEGVVRPRIGGRIGLPVVAAVVAPVVSVGRSAAGVFLLDILLYVG